MNEDIHTRARLADGARKLTNVRVHGEVHGVAPDLRRVPSSGTDEVRQRVLGATNEHCRRATSNELCGNRGTDSAGRTGDNCRLTRKVAHMFGIYLGMPDGSSRR